LVHVERGDLDKGIAGQLGKALASFTATMRRCALFLGLRRIAARFTRR
jgi:hypothetical protein